MKEIKDLNKRKNTLCSWNEQLSTIKMSILYILIYTFITVKIPTSNFFVCFEMAVYWIYLPARYHVHPFAVYTVFSRINRLYLTHLLKGSVSNNVTHKSLCLPKGNVVSPLHINLEITNFQRCKHATYYQDNHWTIFFKRTNKIESIKEPEPAPSKSVVSEIAGLPPSITDDSSALLYPTSTSSSSQ